MTVTLDELIKWILTQYDDGMTEEQKRSICRQILSEKKRKAEVKTDEQK